MRAGIHRGWGLRGTQTPDRPLGQGRYEPSPRPCSSSLSSPSIPYKDRTFHSQRDSSDGPSYLLTISPQLKTCEVPSPSTASRQSRCRSPPGEPPTKAQAPPGAMMASGRYCLKQPIYKHCSEGVWGPAHGLPLGSKRGPMDVQHLWSWQSLDGVKMGLNVALRPWEHWRVCQRETEERVILASAPWLQRGQREAVPGCLAHRRFPGTPTPPTPPPCLVPGQMLRLHGASRPPPGLRALVPHGGGGRTLSKNPYKQCKTANGMQEGFLEVVSAVRRSEDGQA